MQLLDVPEDTPGEEVVRIWTTEKQYGICIDIGLGGGDPAEFGSILANLMQQYIAATWGKIALANGYPATPNEIHARITAGFVARMDACRVPADSPPPVAEP